MKKLRKAWALSGSDWLVLQRAWVLLVGVEIGLRLLPFRTLLVLLEKGNFATKAAPVVSPMRPERIAYLVEVAARYSLLRPTCLKKSLVLYALLKKTGLEATLVIGTTSRQAGFQAHAWVERDGQILGSRGAGDYAQLASFEAARSPQQIA